jgi:hypothetical protein
MSNPTTKIRFPVFRDYEVRVILAKHMFKVSGARMDDEAFAHHIGYLVGRIHKFLLRHIDAE